MNERTRQTTRMTLEAGELAALRELFTKIRRGADCSMMLRAPAMKSVMGKVEYAGTQLAERPREIG